MKSSLKKAIFSFFLIFSAFFSFANENSFDFYGISSPTADKNMIKMAEELFIAQLKELSYTVFDMRPLSFVSTEDSIQPDFSRSSEDSNIFYVTMENVSEGKDSWNCSIHLINRSNGKNITEVKSYDSYYRILMEKKEFLSEILASFYDENNQKNSEERNIPETKRIIPASTQNIAGTWSGDSYIDKVVILKGGRGFIIYKNGASMNITVNVSSDSSKTVHIIQSSRSNASFFPEMDRKKALEIAMTAKPLEWNFTLIDEKTLKGTKTSITEKGSYEDFPAIWSKKDL